MGGSLGAVSANIIMTDVRKSLLIILLKIKLLNYISDILIALYSFSERKNLVRSE